MLGIHRSSAAQSVLDKQRDLVAQYTNYRNEVAQLQQRAFQELLPEIVQNHRGLTGWKKAKNHDLRVGANLHRHTDADGGRGDDPGFSDDENDEDVETRVSAFLSDQGEEKLSGALPASSCR